MEQLIHEFCEIEKEIEYHKRMLNHNKDYLLHLNNKICNKAYSKVKDFIDKFNAKSKKYQIAICHNIEEKRHYLAITLLPKELGCYKNKPLSRIPQYIYKLNYGDIFVNRGAIFKGTEEQLQNIHNNFIKQIRKILFG